MKYEVDVRLSPYTKGYWLAKQDKIHSKQRTVDDIIFRSFHHNTTIVNLFGPNNLQPSLRQSQAVSSFFAKLC